MLPWPNLSAGAYPNPNFPASLNGPTSVVDQNAGRPARQVQWSAGFQREIIKDLVVDVAYVGNRGAWWLSSILDNYNALTPQILTANGLDINNAADRAILRAQIGSTAAGRFQNKLPYAGFPATSTVAQVSAAVPAVLKRTGPAVGPAGTHMVRLASGEGHEAVLPWPDRRLRLHLGEGGATRRRRYCNWTRSTIIKTACRTNPFPDSPARS